jgi:hypothetical protein
MSHHGDPRNKGIHDEAASHRIFGYDLSQHPSHVQLSICMTGVIILYLFYGYFQVCSTNTRAIRPVKCVLKRLKTTFYDLHAFLRSIAHLLTQISCFHALKRNLYSKLKVSSLDGILPSCNLLFIPFSLVSTLLSLASMLEGMCSLNPPLPSLLYRPYWCLSPFCIY